MSPAVTVRAAIPFRGKAGFNPIALSGLVWFLHPDDATDVVAGEINSCVDRKALATFTAPAAVNRMPRNTTERPGHVAAQTVTTSADFLRSDAAGTASPLNASPAHTWFWLGRHTATSFLLQASNGTAFGSGGDRITISISSTAVQFNISGLSNWIMNHGVTYSQWHSYAVTYDGAGNASLYVDGAFKITIANTHRVTTNLLRTFYCAGQGYVGPAGMCTGIMSTANIADLHTWLLANA